MTTRKLLPFQMNQLNKAEAVVFLIVSLSPRPKTIISILSKQY